MSNANYMAGWDRVFNKNKVEFIGERTFVGRMPIRQDIEILPADQTKQLKLGWTVSEVIGMSIVNPSAVRRGMIRPSFKDLLAKMTTDEQVRQFIVNESNDNPKGMTALFDTIQNHYPQYHKFLKLFSFA